LCICITNLSNPCHGYGLVTGSRLSTCTCTLTNPWLQPVRVRKPVTFPSRQSKSSRGGVHNSHSGWISCSQCQSKSSRGGAHNSRPRWNFMQAMSAIKIKQRRCTQLTCWMGFHAGNVSNQNQAEEVHTTHTLDEISCRQCQQSKSSRGGAHNSQAG